MLVLTGGLPPATTSKPPSRGEEPDVDGFVSVGSTDPGAEATPVVVVSAPGVVTVVPEPGVVPDGTVVVGVPSTVVPDDDPDEVVVEPGATVVSAPVCGADPWGDEPDTTGTCWSTGVDPGMTSCDGILTTTSPVVGEPTCGWPG